MIFRLDNRLNNCGSLVANLTELLGTTTGTFFIFMNFDDIGVTVTRLRDYNRHFFDHVIVWGPNTWDGFKGLSTVI